VAEPNFSDQLSSKSMDTIDTVVATVNDKAVRPAVVASRGVVFGVIIGVIAVTVAVLLCVGFIRLVTVYLAGGRVWVSYLALGAILCIGGAFLYSRRGSPSADG
jgi:hypothetical protein